MKKSDLRNLIAEVVRRKLAERGTPTPVPESDVADVVQTILDRHAIDKIRIIARHGSEQLGVDEIWYDRDTLYISVHGSPLDVKEGLETDSAEAANPPVTPEKNRDDAELVRLREKLEKITNDIKVLEANIAKRNETVSRANQRDERRKNQLMKQQGPVIKKMRQSQDKSSGK